MASYVSGYGRKRIYKIHCAGCFSLPDIKQDFSLGGINTLLTLPEQQKSLIYLAVEILDRFRPFSGHTPSELPVKPQPQTSQHIIKQCLQYRKQELLYIIIKPNTSVFTDFK